MNKMQKKETPCTDEEENDMSYDDLDDEDLTDI